MQNRFSYIVLIIVLFSTQLTSYGQQKSSVEMPVVFSIPAIALIDFAGTGAQVTFTSGSEAELIVTPNAMDHTWINYSSVIEEGSSNCISAHVSSGNLPSEVRIKLNVGEDSGEGAGDLGTPTGEVTLVSYPQNIITGIGSCYTGRGAHKGRQLTYSWEGISKEDLDMFSQANLEISVTFTITSTE